MVYGSIVEIDTFFYYFLNNPSIQAMSLLSKLLTVHMGAHH